MLPLDATPAPGEAFAGYLHRIAALIETDPHSLYGHLRLRVAGRTARYVHLALPEWQVRDVSRELGIEREQLEATLVRHFAGLDLRALTGAHADIAHRTVQRGQWLFLSGTRYCAPCLEEGRPWLNAWQLPWTFMCATHRVLLAGACSHCGRRPDLVVRTSSRSQRCTPERCACGHPWGGTPPGPDVGDDLADLQRQLGSAAEGRSEPLWGSVTGGHDRLAAWRAAGAATARATGMRPWARRPFLVPPTDPTTMAEVVTRAAPILTAESLSTAADALGALLAERSGLGEAAIWDVFPRSSPLAPVARMWLRRSGRVHSRLARSQDQALPLVAVPMDRIPTLADPRWLPPRWRDVAAPDVTFRRAAVSLAVARLAGAGTWSTAGHALGLDGDYAARTVRHVLHRLGDPAPSELTNAAQAYAAALNEASPVARRPHDPVRGVVALSAYAHIEDRGLAAGD